MVPEFFQVLAVGVKWYFFAERRPVGQAVVGKHGCTGLRLVKVFLRRGMVVDAAAHGGYQGHAATMEHSFFVLASRSLLLSMRRMTGANAITAMRTPSSVCTQ